MNKQPFYHHVEVLFTATDDLSEDMNTREFKDSLEKFLKKSFPKLIVKHSLVFDTPVTAEPGDPTDLM